MLRLLSIAALPLLIAGQEFQCGTDKIQADIAKTVVQFNCKDKVSDINSCCIAHDGCYDKQQPRATCDASFCTCVAAASAGNPLCGFYTSIFCDTAKVFGEAAYKKVAETRAKEAAEGGAADASATQAASPPERPTPPPYAPVSGGQTAAEAVAAAEAAASAQAARYRDAKHVTPSSLLLFTPFPDPMERLQQWLHPTSPAPRTTTIDPLEIDRLRKQKMAQEAFERSIHNSRRANPEQRLRDRLQEEAAQNAIKAMAEMKHAHPTATPPPAHGYYRGKGGKQYRIRDLEEAEISEKIKKLLRGSHTKRGVSKVKKLAPSHDNAFNEDDSDEVEEVQADEKPSNIRRAPTAPPTTTTVAPAPTTTQPALIKPPTTFDNLFHNVPSNSEPRPFAEVKTSAAAASESTTVASIFHAKPSFTEAHDDDTTVTKEDDPTASILHRKDPLPITEFLKDQEALDTLSSINLEPSKDEEVDEETRNSRGNTETSHQQQPLKEGFTPVSEEPGPFESLLQEAQEHLKESQKRVDELIKDQRLKIEREEKERKRILEEKRRKLEEERRLLEERKKRRDQKRKDRLARQRQIAEEVNQIEWSRRIDQEAKVKALEDSTRVPEESPEDEEEEAPTTTAAPKKKKHHKKHRTTTTVEPEEGDEEESISAETTTAKPKHKLARHAKNELDSDSYEAYEQWLRWREKRRLARRKQVVETEDDE